MKKLLILIVGFLLSVAPAFSQSVITGTVMDAELNAPLSGANVIESGTSNGTMTDFDGKFSIETTANSGLVVVSYVGYQSMTVSFDGSTDLGTLTLVADNSLGEIVIVGSGVIDLADDRKTPVAVSTIRSAEIQARAVGNVEFGEALKNTPSVYVSNQAGGFGDSQIFTRGFSQSNTAFLLNGQPINGMEDGKMYWSNWSGMSDVANAVQVQRGLGSSKLAISSVGGTVNIVSKTTNRTKGGFVRFLTGNDSYFKTTASYDSGLDENGWAFSILMDHWQGHRKYAVGTAGQGQNYFFSVGYKASERSTFNFLVTGAPQWHDQNFSKRLDEFEQYGNKYNDNSGFYNGRRFTERRNYYHKPIANINWDFNINETLDLSTVLYASWGRGGGTGGWGRGRIRYDDPESINSGNGEEIDFDAIEVQNTSIPGGIGYSDSDDPNYSPAYARRASVNNHNWYGVVSNLNIDNGGPLTYNIGFDGRTYTGDHFRQLTHMFGLDAWSDNGNLITQTFDANPWASLSNYADEDQRIAYDYSETINYLGGFAQAEYATDNLSAFLQGSVSTQSYQRDGGNVAGDAGKSEKINKSGYNLKGGLGYTSNDDQHKLFANAGIYSRQPFLDNIFDNVRYSNDLINNGDVENEEVIGFEAGYRFQSDEFRLNIDAYSTEWGNRYLSFGGQDDAGDDVFYNFNDVTQIHTGIEFDFQYKPMAANGLAFNVFGSIGDWKYKDTTPYRRFDGETNQLEESGEVNLSDVKVGQAPQTSFGVGLDWDATDRLTLYSSFNYFDDFYGFVDVEDIIQAGVDGEAYEAEELNSYGLLDLGLSYDFTLGGKNVLFRANVYNLLDKDYVNQKDAYGYFKGNGTTWNASFQYRF
ncbi:TonB-dependent receptor [Flavobacteriaceae bacterium]|nr:TonB-dependent receptor [Flavobacteriaceae bacterium]MDA9846553.1 TonB-dependent receptor [Flavobacteriaceae bacterium]